MSTYDPEGFLENEVPDSGWSPTCRSCRGLGYVGVDSAEDDDRCPDCTPWEPTPDPWTPLHECITDQMRKRWAAHPDGHLEVLPDAFVQDVLDAAVALGATLPGRRS